MGRLVAFLGTAAVLLVALAAFNWWVDPFGEFWKPAAVQDARAARPQCLVSHELIGGEYLPFKLDVFRSRPTRSFRQRCRRTYRARRTIRKLSCSAERLRT